MTSKSTAEQIIEWSVLGNITILNLNCSGLTSFPPSLFQSYFRSRLKELYAKVSRNRWNSAASRYEGVYVNYTIVTLYYGKVVLTSDCYYIWHLLHLYLFPGKQA